MTKGIARRAALAAALAGCARFPPGDGGEGAAVGEATVYLASASPIHTEVQFEWPAEEALPPPFPGPGFVGVSFGSRDYFAGGDSAGPVELLRAFVTGPGAILVVPRPGPFRLAVAMGVAADGPRRLARAVAADLARDGDGRPVLIRPSSPPGAVFLEAVPPYSLAYTCNTWSLDLLAKAGVPVSGIGVVTPELALAAARLAAARGPAAPVTTR